MRLKLATWNINSVRARLDLVRKFVTAHRPDILCLQELKAADEHVPLDALKALGFEHAWVRGQKGYNGVAILSRAPLAATEFTDWCDKGDSRHVAARLPDGTVLHNFYVPAGGDLPDPLENPKFAHKLQFLREMAAWSKKLGTERRHIMVGDLNVAPLPTDVWSHKQLLTVVSHTPVEVKHMDRLQQGHGWVDAVRHVIRPEVNLYSWWSYRAQDWRSSDRGRRLDHVWVSPALAAGIVHAEVAKDARDWDKASDHVPVLVTLDLREARVSRDRILVGLIGAGIQASRTPAMHEAEGDRQGLRYLYQLIDLETLGVDAAALPELINSAERLGFAGLNITYPCKQTVIPLLDELSPAAKAIGAVNTVVLQGGKRIGHNTDCSGFAAAFAEDMMAAPRQRVLQLGAGGAGAAVGHALLEQGIERLAIHDVDRAKAAGLVDNLALRFGPGRAAVAGDLAREAAAAQGLVNTTPVGMAKLPGTPIDIALLRPELWLIDIIYFPAETELLRAARARGCRAHSGAGMAVHQAVDAFRLFTGRPADAARMRQQFESM